MQIDHVVPYIGAESSGPAQCIPALCNGLCRCGVQVVLHALDPLPKDEYLFEKHGYPWRKFPCQALGFSPEMHSSLCKRAHVADIIHNNSLWMMPNIYPGMAVRNTECKLVTSPHGTMSEYSWARSRWKKSIVWLLGQKFELERTDLFHATSINEFADIRRLGWRQPVAVIHNGITMPSLSELKQKRCTADSKRRILLFLSRIHPTKNVASLLKTWQLLEHKYPDWDLWICGPLEGAYPKEMVALSRQLHLRRVDFKGEVLGDEKSKTYCSADLFVLPTHSENFGMVVGEALAHCVPAVVTKGAPWRGLESNQCGWWIDNDERALYDALVHAMGLSRVELNEMGEKGRTWMERDFSWDALAEDMRGAYEWLLHGGVRPDCVYVD